MLDKTLIKASLLYGVIMGAGFCLYTTLMWLTKLDADYLNIGQYLDIAIIILPIVLIFMAIKKALKLQPISLLQRLNIAVIIGAIAYLIYSPFLYLYHHTINPNWFAPVLHLKELDLIAAHTSPYKIDSTLQTMKAANASQSAMFTLGATIVSVIVLPGIIGLLSLVFIKKRSVF